jgi:hypothetical protein
MQKFENKVVKMPFKDGPYSECLGRNEKFMISAEALENHLNKYSDEGWEFCSYIPDVGLVFKRRIVVIEI